MKKFAVLISVFCVAVVVLVSVIVSFVAKGELRADKERLALCEMLAIGQVLNKHFETKKSYPKSLAASLGVENLEGINPCKGKLQASSDGYLDPWGNAYLYERISYGYSIVSSSQDIKIYLIDGGVHLEESSESTEGENYK